MENIVFIGDWTKDRVLGSGSFGTVVLWKHKRTDEKLAIKTCKWGNELTQKHKERWTKEVEMMQTCNNRNIVGTKELPPEFVIGLESANPSKLPILCMEYCSGEDLRQLLNKPESCAGLKETQVRQILSDVKNAVQFLHSHKITHRDLKPENIVLHVQDSSGRSNLGSLDQRKVSYKLIDLGYAKEIDSNSVCASFVGTLQYLAPEIFHSKTYSNSVDFWSFGILAFELICGVRPFLPFMAPVQWMPYVKKKAHDHICIYETFHGDVENSSEIFSENHINQPLKQAIEQWLKIALEWEPKLRGRDTPSKVTFNIPSEGKEVPKNIVFFDVLQKVLSKKIIKIFSVCTLRLLAYEIDESTSVQKLKAWIQNDTEIPSSEQVLIYLLTYLNVSDDDMILKYYNEECKVVLYLFSKTVILKQNLEPKVPIAVQRCLEHPKALYNFKNSQNLYRNGLYFVMSEMEIYEHLINSLVVRGESIKQESKQLLLKHNSVDKSMGKLLTKEESITQMVETGKKHIEILREKGTGINFLGGFDKIFKEFNDLADKINKLQTAWSQLTVRLQSAARRSNEILSVDLNNFVSKYNYQAIFSNAVKSFILHKKTEYSSDKRGKEKPCTDIMKICYDCLKLRSKILLEMQHQPFVLKIIDLSAEFLKISSIISVALENTDKLITDLSALTEELNNCMWSTISILSSDADNLADLPYSVVSFHKQDFKVGEPVSNHCITVKNKVEEDEYLKSLIQDSIRVRQNNSSLSEKLKMQSKMFKNSVLDFSFLNES